MEDNSRIGIRKLLKRFGIKADENLVAHLARNLDIRSLKVRITLEDLTDYGDKSPEGVLTFSVEEEIER